MKASNLIIIRLWITVTAGIGAAMTCPAARAGFAIRDGDTVVFLGDSITASRQYGKIIETYCLLRFPERRVRFVNAGKGGETAKLSLERLDRAVFAEGATLVTVAYGVNDIGWGTQADEAHKRDYLDAVGQLVERCQRRGVRAFICSAAITAEDPDGAEKGFLQQMCDEGLALARSRGAGAIDVQRVMRAVQRRVLAANAKRAAGTKPTSLHVEDGVHLNDLGQAAMAFAILKGLGAPADVSAATIDATSVTAPETTGCAISDIQSGDGELAFTRRDDRLPLNLQPLWMLHGLFIPIGDELNRYLLTILHLPEGRYDILAGGRPLGTWTAEDLGGGINIASATADPWQPGGPWDAQAQTVKILTDMRDEIVFARRNMDSQLDTHPRFETLRARTKSIEARLVALQRDLAGPVPVRFIVRRRERDGVRAGSRKGIPSMDREVPP